MALLFADGFGHVDDPLGSYVKWDYVRQSNRVAYNDAYGRDGGYGLWLWEDYWIERNIPTSSNVAIVGVAMWTESIVATNGSISLLDGTVSQVQLKFNADGSISAWNNTALLGTTATGLFAPQVWKYIELKVLFSTTVGTVEVRVDGVSVLSLSNVNTANSGNEYYVSLRLRGQWNSRFDDLYVCDSTGTENNDFLGDITITLLYPISDGTHTDFTPSTGVDNYATVDEPRYNEDVDHNESSTVGHIDTYNMSQLPDDLTIFAVQSVPVGRTTDGGSRTIRNICRSGATPADNESADIIVSATMKVLPTVWEKEPTDDVAWTIEKINAAEFGQKVQS